MRNSEGRGPSRNCFFCYEIWRIYFIYVCVFTYVVKLFVYCDEYYVVHCRLLIPPSPSKETYLVELSSSLCKTIRQFAHSVTILTHPLCLVSLFQKPLRLREK
jgi:hypothetical protein